MTSSARHAMVISAFTMLGLGLGLASNMVVASRFGAGAEMDLYLAATTLPLFFATILAGLFNSTFLPVFIEAEQGRPEDAWKLASGVLNATILACAGICVAGMAFAGPVMAALAPGFGPEATAKAADLLRIMLPGMVFTCANELAAGVFYSRKSFLAPSMNRVVSPLLTIASVLLLADRLDTRSLAWAMVGSAAVQAALLGIQLMRLEGFRWHPALVPLHPLSARVLRNMAPLAGAMLLYKGVPVFDRWLASGLPEGSISHLGYATRLLAVLQPILLSGISISMYPVMAGHAARKDLAALRDTLGRCVRALLFASVPVAAFLALFGLPVVQLLFERGAFDHQASLATHRAFSVYLLGLPAALAGTMVGQGFYALQDTRTPALIGYAETAAYVLIALLLVGPLGVMALPATHALYFTASVIAGLFLLGRRMGTGCFGTILPALWRQAMAASLGAAAAFPLRWLLPPGAPAAILEIGLASAVYFLACRFVFKSAEASYFQDLLLGRLKSALRMAPKP